MRLALLPESSTLRTLVPAPPCKVRRAPDQVEHAARQGARLPTLIVALPLPPSTLAGALRPSTLTVSLPAFVSIAVGVVSNRDRVKVSLLLVLPVTVTSGA